MTCQTTLHFFDQIKTGNNAIRMTKTPSVALLPVRNKLKSSYLVDKDLSLSEDGVLRNSNQPKMPYLGFN